MSDFISFLSLIQGHVRHYTIAGFDCNWRYQFRLDNFLTFFTSFLIAYDLFFKFNYLIYVEDNPILQAKQHQQQRASVSSSVENKTIRPLSQTKKNPFAKKSEASASPRGLAIFDAVKEKGAAVKSNSSSAKENVNAKTKSTKQPTLFSMKKTTSTDDSAASQSSKTGFMLWLELNKAQLQEENPDATEVELTRLAAQKFRALPEDQRQVSITIFSF